MKWQITPTTTFIMVLLALSPCLFKTWRDPRPRLIARSVAYAYTCGFLFGWHVHEKASLHFVIPLAIVALESLEDAKHYFLLSIGNVSPCLCYLLVHYWTSTDIALNKACFMIRILLGAMIPFLYHRWIHLLFWFQLLLSCSYCTAFIHISS